MQRRSESDSICFFFSLFFLFFFQKDRANKLISFTSSWPSSWHFHYTKWTYFSLPRNYVNMCYRLYVIAPLLWLSHKMFYFIDDELSYKSFTSVQNILRKGTGLLVLTGAGWLHCTPLFFHQVPSCFCGSFFIACMVWWAAGKLITSHNLLIVESHNLSWVVRTFLYTT